PLGDIAAMTIDPANSKNLYVAAGGKESPGLFLSTDSGETWHRESGLPEPPTHLWIDPHSPASARIIYAGGPHGIVKAGAESAKSQNLAPFNDITMGFADGKSVAYATSPQGVFVSKDAGSMWQKASLPGSGAQVRAVAASWQHPEIAYVSYSELKL